MGKRCIVAKNVQDGVRYSVVEYACRVVAAALRPLPRSDILLEESVTLCSDLVEVVRGYFRRIQDYASIDVDDRKTRRIYAY